MPKFKNIVVVWNAGSGGDLLISALCNHYASAQVQYQLDENGRMIPRWDPEFVKHFPAQPYKHFNSRDWRNDLGKLESLSAPFLIGTSSEEQSSLLKNHFGSDLGVVAINYGKNLWPFVIKGFCNKVLDSKNYLTRNSVGEKFLQVVAKTPEEQQYYIRLGETKQLGLWYAKYLIDGTLTSPPTQSLIQCDIEITVDQLLSPTHVIDALSRVNEHINFEAWMPIYHAWHQQQDPLYTHCIDHTGIQECLGWNPLATAPMPYYVLSKIDQLLIQSYFGSEIAPVKTYQDLMLIG
jgi:hypothetical protein